jgi:pilus assembly protein CpaC
MFIRGQKKKKCKYLNNQKGEMMIKKVFLILAIISLPFFIVGSQAQSFLSTKNYDNEITLVVGEVSVFRFDSLDRVSIRNPQVADISKVTGDEVVIVAKQVGDTVLSVWEGGEKKEFFINVHPQDLDRVKEKLKGLINKQLGISSVYFKKNEASGKIMVRGEVTEVQKEHIEQALASFYGATGESNLIDNMLTIREEDRMVEIECQILELSKTDLDKLGIKWQEFLTIGEGNLTGAGTSLSRNYIKSGVPWMGMWDMDVWSRTGLGARIDMLVREGTAKILSRPKLLCLSGKEAELTVGGEIPYVSATATNVVGTGLEIEYRDYGVILNLQPQVLEDDKLVLNVAAEISELDWDNGITVADIKIPAFTKRQADTIVNMVSGDTVFLGGLIENKESENIDKLPALGDIPILGALFRSKEFRNAETELVITLTPIIKTSRKEGQAQEVIESERKDLPSQLTVYPHYLQDQAALNEYVLSVKRMIYNSLDYPRLAREAGWQGVVKLKLHLNYDGELLGIKVSQSSGYVSFDNAAINVAKSISPYPPFPASVEVEDLWIDVPVVYKLD